MISALASYVTYLDRVQYYSNVPNIGHLFSLFASADRKKTAAQTTSHGKDATYGGTYSHKLTGF